MRDVGDLAVVLHSHMPYVEGFGTYPFGEEWLFDAFARSHLPVLSAARDLTLTVTPVLADQLEAPGVGERMRAFLERHRLGAAERDAAEAAPELRPAARAEAERYRGALARLEQLDGHGVEAFAAPAREGRVELIPSAATHAVMPLLATEAGQRLQIDAGLRSHRRRFSWSGGFWLPECAHAPGLGLERVLAERGVTHTCVDQSPREGSLDPLNPIRMAAGGPVGFSLDWPAVELVWSDRGYPSDPAYAEFHRLSVNGTRLWSIGGDPHDPDAAGARAREHANEFAAEVAARLERFQVEHGRRGLLVFAIDTELLGHWWSEGPVWLDAVLHAVPERGVRLVTLARALADHPAVERPLRATSWGEGKDLSTWSGPAVADLAWGARRLELRLLRALGLGLDRPAAERAARELLAVQASDWAFLDARRTAGDYPFRRATSHAQRLLEAIDSGAKAEPRMRNLAPDLSIAPLLEP